MTYGQAIIMGIIQGVAEFLPVSSSGHLVVLQDIMDLEVPLLFDVLMHIPTLVAVLIVFRKRVAKLFSALFRFRLRNRDQEVADNLRLVGIILVATLVTGIMGVGFSRVFESFKPSSALVGALFLVTAAILIGARFLKGSKQYGQLGVKEGLITGFAQGLGVLPGISRSGITISGSLLAGMDREKAGEYSFLISVPAILGALILELKDLDKLSAINPMVLAVGMITCFIVGILSLLLLMKMLRSGKLYLFSIYLIPLGIISIIWL